MDPRKHKCNASPNTYAGEETRFVKVGSKPHAAHIAPLDKAANLTPREGGSTLRDDVAPSSAGGNR